MERATPASLRKALCFLELLGFPCCLGFFVEPADLKLLVVKLLYVSPKTVSLTGFPALLKEIIYCQPSSKCAPGAHFALHTIRVRL